MMIDYTQPTHEETLLKQRARTALAAAENEKDETLRAALMARVFSLHRKAIALQFWRKNTLLQACGIPTQA